MPYKYKSHQARQRKRKCRDGAGPTIWQMLPLRGCHRRLLSLRGVTAPSLLPPITTTPTTSMAAPQSHSHPAKTLRASPPPRTLWTLPSLSSSVSSPLRGLTLSAPPPLQPPPPARRPRGPGRWPPTRRRRRIRPRRGAPRWRPSSPSTPSTSTPWYVVRTR